MAASASTARSATTFCISGRSASREPKARRWPTCHAASLTARRISAVDPSTQSSRVAATISMIVRTPRPSSPSRWASVPSSSSSLEALERLPSLSLSRTTSSRLRLPSGSTRGTTKQVTPASVWASTRNTSFIGAEVNHLCPWRVYSPSVDVGTARVTLARTSEPPCFSVMPMPASAPRLPATGRSPGSYDVDASSGVHSLASASSARSAGTAAYVIEIGQPCPGSVCDQAMKPAARRTWACGLSDSHGVAASPWPTARSISQCHEGWKSTSSTRLPQRSYERSRGGFSLASIPCSRASAVPASRPRAERSSTTSADAWRVTASTSDRSAVTTSCPARSGAWLPLARRRPALARRSPRDRGCSCRYRRHMRDLLWRLTVTTTGSCIRYRVTGLAAEAAFFAILSVPPLVFALAGAIGYVSEQFSPAEIAEVRQAVIDLSSRALTEDAVNRIIVPTINDVLRPGRFDVISLGFILSLWSGSRALNVFVDTITIMHGLGGHRGIVKTRALSFLLYILAIITGVFTLPLVVAGPSLVRELLPEQLEVMTRFYWPTVLILSICFLATLYHVSVPVRTNWTFNLPGATFALAAWIFGSFLLRWILTIDGGRVGLDLRPAGLADRGAAVALPALAGGADRRRGQRGLRLGLPAAGDQPRPGGAGATPAAPDDAPAEPDGLDCLTWPTTSSTTRDARGARSRSPSTPGRPGGSSAGGCWRRSPSSSAP